MVLSAACRYREDSDLYFRDLKRRSAESGITTYIVQLYQPDPDASQQGKPALPTNGFLSADLSRKVMVPCCATGARNPFRRRARAGCFRSHSNRDGPHVPQLGIKSVAADGDGKAHDHRGPGEATRYCGGPHRKAT